MKNQKLFSLALKNIRQRKLRTFLTVFGISIAISMFFFLVNTAETIKKQAIRTTSEMSNFSRINVTPKFTSEKTSFLTSQDIEKIKSIEKVRSAYPDISLSTALQFDLTSKSAGTEVSLRNYLVEDKEQIPKELRLQGGNLIKSGAFLSSNGVLEALVTEKLAEKLGVSPGEIANLTVRTTDEAGTKKSLGSFNVTIKGVTFTPVLPNDTPAEVKEQFENVGIISHTTALEIHAMYPGNDQFTGIEYKKDQFSGVVVFAESADQVQKVQDLLRTAGYEAFSAIDQVEAINQFFVALKAAAGAISLVALLVSLIGITNTMFMSILERTKEVGVLKSLGASSTDIQKLFIFESAAYGIAGAIIGVLGAAVLGYIAVAIVRGAISKNIPTYVVQGANMNIQYSLDGAIIMFTIIGAVLLAIVAGSIPARRASKLNPIKALRHE